MILERIKIWTIHLKHNRYAHQKHVTLVPLLKSIRMFSIIVPFVMSLPTFDCLCFFSLKLRIVFALFVWSIFISLLHTKAKATLFSPLLSFLIFPSLSRLFFLFFCLRVALLLGNRDNDAILFSCHWAQTGNCRVKQSSLHNTLFHDSMTLSYREQRGDAILEA